jgi:hypothetical protein
VIRQSPGGAPSEFVVLLHLDVQPRPDVLIVPLATRERGELTDVYGVNRVDFPIRDRLPLLERKRRLFAIMPKIESRVLYLNHVHERAVDLFRAACERNLEGIVESGRTAAISANHVERPG